jgi:hypothetical protein
VQLFFILHLDLGVPIGAPKLFLKPKGTLCVPFGLIETALRAVSI